MILSLKLSLLSFHSFFFLFSMFINFSYTCQCQKSYFTVGESAHEQSVTMSGHDFITRRIYLRKLKKYLSKHQFYPQYLLFGHHMEKLLRDNLNDTTQ